MTRAHITNANPQASPQTFMESETQPVVLASSPDDSDTCKFQSHSYEH